MGILQGVKLDFSSCWESYLRRGSLISAYKDKPTVSIHGGLQGQRRKVRLNIKSLEELDYDEQDMGGRYVYPCMVIPFFSPRERPIIPVS